jgi:alpha,alpha-trehalose phosphorylase
VITQSAFPVEPWSVRETHLDLDLLAQSESVFALSNGHIGLRGNLDEGEPHGIPGTYLTSFYELRPLPYAESAYGNPESSESIVNVTNGKLIRLLVDDEPFDLRYGTLVSHERVLDLRAGTLCRQVEWVSPAGKRVRVTSTRLVSFTQRAIAAVEYQVEAVDASMRIVVQSELVANEAVPAQTNDPRQAAAMESPLDAVDQSANEHGVVLVHRTRASKLQMAAAMAHAVEASGHVDVEIDVVADWARLTAVVELQPGEKLKVVKYLAYGWSNVRTQQALRDQVAGAVTTARLSGFDGLLAEQREYLDDFWDGADVEVDGDDEIQQAVRFGLFHVLQAGARAEGRGIPAKGLTGPGYDGHTFWDTEMFVLPVLCYSRPEAAAYALRWRYSTLDQARARAQTLGISGAAFAWRTISGQECSGYWPAGTAAMHITADVALALGRYTAITGDESVEVEGGVELLAETARLWMSLGSYGSDNMWHIAGVTGPDEYTALVDDNTFTNLAATHNLGLAADAAERHPDVSSQLGITGEEIAQWRAAAAAVYLPYAEHLRVHEQCAGFTTLPEWDFEARKDAYPLLLHVPYFELYRRQVIKQADVEFAMYPFGHHFSDEDKARGVDYYEPRTVRDSSLSASVQAVVCAEVGHLELAHDYAYEAALIDLHDIHNNTRDGLHIASLAGAWIALVAGFGGLRDTAGKLSFDPHLPRDISRLCFNLRWHGLRLKVTVKHDEATYSLRAGHDGDGADGADGGGSSDDGTVTFRHGGDSAIGGEDVTLRSGEAVTRPITARSPLLPRPKQPPGREPAARPGSERETSGPQAPADRGAGV